MDIPETPRPSGRLWRACFTALFLAAAILSPGPAPAQLAGPNVNMVSGTTWPDGDPFLQRQNEPSIAVSTRNPLHLLAGANDYRTVDLPGLPEGKETGDAWLGVFRSVDGGGSWKSTLVRGYPQDQTLPVSPLHGYDAAADPVVRAGTNGLFYYSGIVFDRSLLRSAAFVARFMDLNNETVQPVHYIDTKVVKSISDGSAFIDKPWLEADIPRSGAGTCSIASQTIPAGNLYMAWAEITGTASTSPTRIMFSRSTNCGETWSTSPLQINLGGTVAQGATIAVAPNTGRVYVAWRQFHTSTTTTGCVHEKGYWKDASHSWPVASLVVGGVTYTKAQALVILQKAYPPSDAPGILAQHLIAAKLNVASGANNGTISQVIAAADAWLIKSPLGSTPKPANKQAGLALKDQLEAFNNGLAGTPTCGTATDAPNAILVSRSDDAGVSFSAPLQVATESPFDQGTSTDSFRTNAYPTMAVDETGRAYLAWATRGLATPNSDPVAGDARIVVTTSTDGTTWTTPSPIDQPNVPGHQLFPSITYNTGKILLVYNDYRADASGLFQSFILDANPNPAVRHTVDIRAAIASPDDHPVFTNYSILNLKPSTQVSRYPFIVTGHDEHDAASLQLQWNPPNLPMFQLGTVPFFGDYLDVAGAPRFVPNGGGTWSYNTASSTAPVFHAVWTENRDVVPPADGNWANYVPPGTGHTSLFDGSTPVPDCASTSGGADRTQMRNQNIYTSVLTGGLVVAVPSNSRPLTTGFQRAFVIYVQNTTGDAKQFQLQILNQPTGGTASFQQFSSSLTQTTTIAAYSSISQPVFVTSSSATAYVDVQVTEQGSCGISCLQTTVRINPDSTNPAPANPTLTAGETYNPAVYNPAVYNPAVYNPAVYNGGVLNPAVFNPAVFNLDPGNPAVLNYSLGTPAVLNPAVFNPEELNPAVFNPAVFNPAVFNFAVLSLAFLNPAVFNLAVLNPAVLNPAVFNPAVFNPAVLNPAVLNPAVFNPAVFNPAVLNPAVFNPAVLNPAVFNGSVSEANFQISNTGNATTAYSLNLNLANQQAGLTYQLMIYRLYFVPVANGCQLTEAAHQELLVNDIAPDLSANLLSPNGADSFFLNPGDTAIATLRVIPNTTSGTTPTFNLQDLSVSVVSKSVNTADVAIGDRQPPVAQILAASLPPLGITSPISPSPLPAAVVGSLYSTTLTASGGSGPRTWTVAPLSTLPPGLLLSAAGVLSGTPTTAGTFSFSVRVTDSTQIAQGALVLTVSSAAPVFGSLSYSSQPSGTTAGQTLTAFSVTARDTASNPMSGVNVTVAIGQQACPTCALSGTTTQTTDGSGSATFSDLVTNRGGYGYTLLASATVGSVTLSAESAPFYQTGFRETAPMGTPRVGASMTLLPDGRVLVVGGVNASNTPLSNAEIYDPTAGSWTTTGSLTLGPRSVHTATLLKNGKVLIAGGSSEPLPASNALATAEIFDPATSTFSSTSSLNVARMVHTATLLDNDKVLVAGGGSTGAGPYEITAELFDPATGTFSWTGNMTTARANHTATHSGCGSSGWSESVLLAGGNSPSPYLASAETYDPAAGTFTATTGPMSTPRINHAAALNGFVLVAGGNSGGGTLQTAERFWCGMGSSAWLAPETMSAPREQHTASLLGSGSFLLAGGYDASSGSVLSSAEIYVPFVGFAPTHGMATPRRLHMGIYLGYYGRALVAGGWGSSGTALATAEIFITW